MPPDRNPSRPGAGRSSHTESDTFAIRDPQRNGYPDSTSCGDHSFFKQRQSWWLGHRLGVRFHCREHRDDLLCSGDQLTSGSSERYVCRLVLESRDNSTHGGPGCSDDQGMRHV
jgi:hypothetical protein